MTRHNQLFLFGLVAATAVVLGLSASSSEPNEPVMYAQASAGVCWDGGVCASSQAGHQLETATFSAGCFVDLLEAFVGLDGVVATEACFMYVNDQERYCEAVSLTYDPAEVTYRELVAQFYRHSQPEQNRRGMVFTRTQNQRETAVHYRALLNASGRYLKHITTTEFAASCYRTASSDAHDCTVAANELTKS